MYKELIINVTEHETRVALLEEGNIVELFVERGDESNIAGNIYKGRVQRVLPGMQAAFVDIGLKQAAFLYVDDVAGDPNRHKDDGPDRGADTPVDEEPEKRREYRIETLLSAGQELMVQVAKSPLGTKGARVTTHVSLPGRFLVLMPTVDHIGISRRIEDETERNRLRDLILEERKDNMGYIFRTAAEGIDHDTLVREMYFLNTLWDKILGRNQKYSAPSMLHTDLTVTLRAVRDLLAHEANKVVIDSKAGFDLIQSFLQKIMPDLDVSLVLYNGEEPIFDSYNLEGDISRALKKKVWLKSGGYIVIENTEALVAIDVNTGRYVGKHNFEETILKTNLEAVKEIAYQVRLRNLGGIIIVDFIDMARTSDQEKVYNALKEALKKDKSKTNVLPMSDMGLIQMTRKRVRKALSAMLSEPCAYCEGSGRNLSRQTICYRIYRDIIRSSRDLAGDRFTIRANPDVADLLHGEESKVINLLERQLGIPIEVYPDASLHVEVFDITERIGPR